MKNKLIVIRITLLFLVVALSVCTTKNILKPNIKFEKEGKWFGYISVSREVNWSDINITISAGNYSDIQFSPAPQMSMTYSYENGTTCPDKWLSITSGNALHFLLFNNNITVRLKWIRTNKIIGEWNFP